MSSSFLFGGGEVSSFFIETVLLYDISMYLGSTDKFICIILVHLFRPAVVNKSST